MLMGQAQRPTRSALRTSTSLFTAPAFSPRTPPDRSLPASMASKMCQANRSAPRTSRFLLGGQTNTASKDKTATALAPDTSTASPTSTHIGDLSGVNDVHGNQEAEALNFKANRDRPKASCSTDNVAAIIQALAPGTGTGTRVGQIGNIIASNVVREGAVQKVKQMTFEA